MFFFFYNFGYKCKDSYRYFYFNKVIICYGECFEIELFLIVEIFWISYEIIIFLEFCDVFWIGLIYLIEILFFFRIFLKVLIFCGVWCLN